MKTVKLASMGGTGKTTVAASLEAERDRLQMIYRVEILLYRDGYHDNPEIFVLLDEGDDEAPAILPEAGDFLILDGGVHMGRVTTRTFSYDLDKQVCHVMINADRVTRPPRAVNSP